MRRTRTLLTAFLIGAGLPACALFRPSPPTYDPVHLPSGVVVHDLVVPEAGPVAAVRDRVAIEYVLELEDGTFVDSSLERGQPIRFRIGDGEVPRGLEQGLVGMRLFGKRELFIPPSEGYGEAGMPPLVPPRATLHIELELLELERAAGPSP